MSITFKDEVAKKLTKSDLPSNIKGRKMDIQFELKNYLGMKIGSMIEIQQPIECHSMIGDKLGVDVPVLLPGSSSVLFAGIDYCSILKHMVLVFVYEDKVLYLDYDKFSKPGLQGKILGDSFKVLINSGQTYAK